jgi:hypothetical protein
MVGGKDGTVGGFIGMTFGEAQEYTVDCVLIDVANPNSKENMDEGLAPRRDRRFRNGDINPFSTTILSPPTPTRGARYVKRQRRRLLNETSRMQGSQK